MFTNFIQLLNQKCFLTNIKLGGFMSLYCVKIKYSLEAIKGMMEDGLDRAEAMRNLTEN